MKINNILPSKSVVGRQVTFSRKLKKEEQKEYSKTINQAMDYLGIGENTLYKLLKSGELGAFRIGRIWKIPYKEINKYIDKSVEKNIKF